MKRNSDERKAKALLSLASHSVGSKQASQAYKLHLKQLLDEYDLAYLQLKTVETEIVSVLDRIPFAKSMLAVKGISAISLAGILGLRGGGGFERLCSWECLTPSCWPKPCRSKVRRMDQFPYNEVTYFRLRDSSQL
jgi:hypothetical protein